MLADGIFRVPFARRSAVVVGAAAAAVAAGLAPQRRLYVIGDSWAAGLYADSAHALGQVAAARLGWHVRVNAVPGTGYLNAAGSGGTYPARTAAIAPGQPEDVVVVQGGSNDDAEDLDDLAAAVQQTVAAVRVRFARARIALLGPGPDPEPVTAVQRQVDRILQGAARGLAVPYVSMLQEDWITPAGANGVLDPSNHHPTVAGQRYLGTRLADSLHRLYPDLTR